MSSLWVAWLVSRVIQVLSWIIIIDALLTFFPNIDRRHPLVVAIRSITEPMYRPIRRLVRPIRMGDAALDLSPLIAILVLQFLGMILVGIIAGTRR